MNKKKEIDIDDKPLLYSLNPKAGPGEVFRVLVINDATFYISNYGRVRRGFHSRKECNRAIISPSRNGGGKFYVRLYAGKLTRCVDLVYEAFIGVIPEGKAVGMKDGDRRNITPKNLVLVPKSRAGVPRPKKSLESPKRRVMKKLVPRAKEMAGLPKELTININRGNKEAKVAELNAKLKYYYTEKVNGGIYLLKLKKA